MKYLNPGVVPLWDYFTCVQSTNKAFNALFDTKRCIVCAWSYAYKRIENCNEFWFSYNFIFDTDSYTTTVKLLSILDSDKKEILDIRVPGHNSEVTMLPSLYIKNTKVYEFPKTCTISITKPTNVEFHVKVGSEDSRIDVWWDTKLIASYRSPVDFLGLAPSYVGCATTAEKFHQFYVSSIILQDTRRIGLEKFKMLDITPNDEQSMPQGSTTEYTVSGLSADTDFSDITSFGVLLQPTSKDANITEGSFSLEGADIGTVDVSSSSGTDYEFAVASVNTLTDKPFTRDDIEGKKLTLTVNGVVNA